jgi:hypothetical protein
MSVAWGAVRALRFGLDATGWGIFGGELPASLMTFAFDLLGVVLALATGLGIPADEVMGSTSSTMPLQYSASLCSSESISMGPTPRPPGTGPPEVI